MYPAKCESKCRKWNAPLLLGIDEFAVQIDEKSFFAKTFTIDHR
jgi:hypothetical protein